MATTASAPQTEGAKIAVGKKEGVSTASSSGFTPKIYVLAALVAATAFLATTSGLVPISLPFLGGSGKASNSFTSPDDLVVIEGTTHCADLHLHAKSNTLFTACDDAESTKFGWFPLLKRHEDPAATARTIGSIRKIDPSVRASIG